MGAWGTAFFDSDSTTDEIGSFRDELFLHPEMRAKTLDFLESTIKNKDSELAEIMPTIRKINEKHKNTQFASYKKFTKAFFNDELAQEEWDWIQQVDDTLVKPQGQKISISKEMRDQIINIIFNYAHGYTKTAPAITSEQLNWEDVAPELDLYNEKSGFESSKKRIYKTPTTIVSGKNIYTETDDIAQRAILLAKMLAIFQYTGNSQDNGENLDKVYLPLYYFKALVFSLDYLLSPQGNNYNEPGDRVTALIKDVMDIVLDNLNGLEHYEFFKEHLNVMEQIAKFKTKPYYKEFYKAVLESSVYERHTLQKEIIEIDGTDEKYEISEKRGSAKNTLKTKGDKSRKANVKKI